MAYSNLNYNEVEYWTNTVASKNMDKRINDFKNIGSPIFTYDELDNEFKLALKKISDLEERIFKLENENRKLKETIEILDQRKF